MVRLIALLSVAISLCCAVAEAKSGGSSSHSSGGSKTVHVSSYVRSNGTVVSAYTRSAPGSGSSRSHSGGSSSSYSSTPEPRTSYSTTPRTDARTSFNPGPAEAYPDAGPVPETPQEIAAVAAENKRLSEAAARLEAATAALRRANVEAAEIQARAEAIREKAELAKAMQAEREAAEKQAIAERAERDIKERAKREADAWGRFRLAKVLVGKPDSKAAGKRRLTELIKEFPGTAAAEESGKLLKTIW